VASVTISVKRSDIVALISGGSSRSQKSNVPFLIDASKSYDQDVSGATGLAAGLQFAWSCVQVAPVFASTCVLELPPADMTQQAKVYVTAPTAA
jgi:hypothetical protein